MDFETLKSGFVEYLKSKYKTSRANLGKFDNLDKDSSIFLYANDFKQYLKKVNSENNLNLSLDGKMSADDEITQILNAVDEAQSDTLTNDSDLLQEIMNSFLSDENVMKKVDENGDGVLGTAEINQFFEDNNANANNLTFDELSKIFNSLQGDTNLGQATTPTADASEADSAAASSGGGSVGGGGSGGGGGSVSSGSGSGDTSTSADSDTSAPKSIENMTEDELKTQKQTASNNVQEKKNELSAYESGEKPGKEDMEKAYQEYTEALGEEKTEKLEQKQNEIKEKHREAKENITNQITTVSAELDTQNNTLTQAQQTYDIASNKITTLENKKSALEGSLSSAEEDKKTSISSQIESIKAEIAAAQKEKDDANTLIQTTNAEIQRLEAQKADLETQLQTEEQAEQQELIEAENEITGDDTELKAKQEAYDKAKETYETQKAQGIKEAKEALATAQKELSAVEVQLAKVQHENEVNEKYPTNEYNFNFQMQESLSSSQQKDLTTVEQVFKEHEAEYKKVEQLTGIPAELVCAIHYRESNNNFTTYLHNGDPLGKTTVHVPKGKFFTDWTEAAVDALTTHYTYSKFNKKSLTSWMDFAESYNGYGMKKKGLLSSYVYAGTTDYNKQGGRYVADGKFDRNSKDNRLGIYSICHKLVSC